MLDNSLSYLYGTGRCLTAQRRQAPLECVLGDAPSSKVWPWRCHMRESRRIQSSVPVAGKKQTTSKRNGYPSADTLFLTSGVGVSDSHGIDIIFTQHARARMADPHRGVVTAEEVRSVLASPTVSYVGIDGKQNVLGEVNGKHIRICFVEDKDRLLIITVINRGIRL